MRKIGALVFPGFELLDLCGPMQFFGVLKDHFELKLVGERPGPVVSNQGPSMCVDALFDHEFEVDILFIPGGKGTRREVENQGLIEKIAVVSQSAEFTLTVCTGSALLAKTGRLDGRKATTNKAAFEWVRSQGPNVDWQTAARWVEDGDIFSSSGVSAGMDMALGAIAKMHGAELARKVALWSEYEWHSDPSWDPFAKAHGLV